MGCHWKQCHCKRGDLYSLYQTGLILRIGVVFLDRWTHFWTSALLRVLRSQLSAELFSPVCPFINYWGRFSNKTSTRNKLHNLVKIQHTHTLRIQAKLFRKSYELYVYSTQILQTSHRTSTLRCKPLLSSFSLACDCPTKSDSLARALKDNLFLLTQKFQNVEKFRQAKPSIKPWWVIIWYPPEHPKEVSATKMP